MGTHRNDHAISACRAAFASSAVVLALALAACGGSSTTASTAPRSSTATAAAAGAAAPFVETNTDNSIPTFGSESRGSARVAAEAALRTYLSARAKGDWGIACAGLAAAVRQQLQGLAGGKGCVAAYPALLKGAPASTRADPLAGPILALRVKGQSGFALFHGPGKKKYVMPMAHESGAWKVTQLAPIAYPLGSETATSP